MFAALKIPSASAEGVTGISPNLDYYLRRGAEMIFNRFIFLRLAMLSAAALVLSIGSARAQNSATSHSSFSSFIKAAVSSSTTSLLDDELSSSPRDGLPSAPGTGGQYDNRSRGGGIDIKSHLTYEVGGGFNGPTSDSSRYITWGWNFTMGAGYRFNRNLAMLLEYQFIHSKLPGKIIAEAGATGGYDHIWSFTLDPEFDFNPRSSIEFFAIGGGGFYRKVTSFTDPQLQYYCDYFYCGLVTQNVVIGHFSSNQAGWNIGGGIAHRFRGWNGQGKMKVFAEARYLHVLSPAVTTEPNGLGTTTVGADTKIIPVTIGLRW